jgi:hypothetical protein
MDDAKRKPSESLPAYDAGYRDGVNDAIRALLAPAVARAARIADTDELAVEVGCWLAEGEETPFDWPAPKPEREPQDHDFGYWPGEDARPRGRHQTEGFS